MKCNHWEAGKLKKQTTNHQSTPEHYTLAPYETTQTFISMFYLFIKA